MAIRNSWRLSGVLFIALSSPALSYALESTSLDLMAGNQTKVGRLGLQLDWQRQWFKGETTHLGAYWDTSYGSLREFQHQIFPGNTSNLHDVGIAAVFRYQRNDRTGFYAEAGTGPHYLSELYDSSGRRQGSRLILNSHAGAGFIWKNGMDLGLKAMHLSNGSVTQPNEAVSMVGVGLRYRW